MKTLKKYKWLIIIILICIIKIIFTSVQDINANISLLYDDTLIVKQANSIISGNWLGEYNCLTLVKGAFAPLFIAFLNIIQVPFLVGQEIFYDISIIFLTLVLNKRIKNKKALVIISIVLLINPIMYCSELIRVYRDGIYVSLIVFLIALTIGIFFNRKEKIKKIVLYQIGLGLDLSAIYLCREEFIWIIPYLMGTVIITIWYILKDKELSNKVKRVSTYFIPICILTISILTIMSINYKYYGVFQLNQYWGKEFKEAYGALTRIKVEEKRKVPITREALSIAYKISPTFAELKDYLEGEEGKKWAMCGDGDSIEIQGGWIHWAIIRAVESKGYYKDAKTANEFYKRVSDEINKACDEGILDSYPKRVSNTGRFDFEDIINTFKKSIDTIKYQSQYYLVKIKGSAPRIINENDEEIVKTFQDVTNQNAISGDTYKGVKNKIKVNVLNSILKIYKKINPILFWSSICISIIYIINNFIKKEKKEYVWILLGLWGMYYSRIFIITFTNVTMYTEAINISYLAPAYMIQILVSILTILLLLKNIDNKIIKKDRKKNERTNNINTSIE